MKLSLKCGFGPCGVIFFAFFTFAAMTCAGTYSGGSGTPDDPYKISTVADWQELTTTSADWNKNFILLNNIDFDRAELNPIGNSITPFMGIFEGNGNVVRRLKIKISSNKDIGLWGNIGNSGIIRNLGIEDGSVNENNSISYVGILCGRNSGNILKCFANGKINYGTYLHYVGGLCGWNSGTIQDCYANSITDCYLPTDIGGLVGRNEKGKIIHCYSIGLLGNQHGGNSILGGLCGKATTGGIFEDTGNFWDTQTSKTTTSAMGTGKTTIQMQSLSTFSSAGWDFTDTDGDPADWQMPTNDYPRLFWEKVATYSGGSGTGTDPFQISTESDWKTLIWDIRSWGKSFILLNDIDFEGASLTPIATDQNVNYFWTSFTGTLNGNGHVLRNGIISLPNQNKVGLFGFLGSSGTISNLGVEKFSVSGAYAVGILCGYSRGTIEKCYTSGTAIGPKASQSLGGLCGYIYGGTIDMSYSSANVIGDDNSVSLGGLCGTNSGSIKKCYATGTIIGGANSSHLGGLCGFNLGTVNDCFATGSVSGGVDSQVSGLIGSNFGTVARCYSTGKPSAGYPYINGLSSGSSSNTDCFWDMETSETPISQYGIGKTTSQMQTFSTYVAAGWDFVNTWSMAVGGYPRLQWENAVHVTYGSLQAMISPDDAVANGAQWRRIGTTSWLNNNQAEMSVPAGYWDVEVKNLSGWIESEPIRVLIQENELLQIDMVYTKIVFPDGDGTQENPYQISTVNDWTMLSLGMSLWDKHFVLLNDIDFEGTHIIPVAMDTKSTYNYLSSVRFNGTLNGNGHMLRNFNIEQPYKGYIGLFSALGNDARIENLRLETISVTGAYCVGGLCGYCSGTIAGCSVVGRVMGKNRVGLLCGYTYRNTITDCTTEGEVVGGNNSSKLGGLFGILGGSIVNNSHSVAVITGGDDSSSLGGLCGYLFASSVNYCHATGSVTGGNHVTDLGGLYGTKENSDVSFSYATGQVIGGNQSEYLGGLGGSNSFEEDGDGNIRNSYATGSVVSGRDSHFIGGLCGFLDSGSIINCYAIGSITSDAGSQNLGGICGGNSGGTIASCFWDTVTSGIEVSAGGVGKSTIEMKTLGTFTGAGWDFVGERDYKTADVWRMCGDGVDYPRLSWEFSRGGDMDCPDGVSMDDVLYLAGRWMAGTAATVGAADGNGDGKVDLQDFGIVASNWMRE